MIKFTYAIILNIFQQGRNAVEPFKKCFRSVWWRQVSYNSPSCGCWLDWGAQQLPVPLASPDKGGVLTTPQKKKRQVMKQNDQARNKTDRRRRTKQRTWNTTPTYQLTKYEIDIAEENWTTNMSLKQALHKHKFRTTNNEV